MRQERKDLESNAAAYLRQKFAATDRGVYLSASPMSLADLPPSRKRVHCPSPARSLSDIFSRLHR